MSVDDVIGDVIETIDELGLSDSTYFFYSSDHGFQLGQFNIPMDKRHVYEWDTKIHLLARGPGIKHGSSFKQPGTQVDIAPTLLGFAGIKTPSIMDGRSIVPFLLQKDEQVLESTQSHLLEHIGNLNTYRENWRQEVFIEYYYCNWNVKCTGVGAGCTLGGDYPKRDSNCVNLANNTGCWCGVPKPSKDPTCYTTEDPTNNFIAIRDFSADNNQLYAEFQTGDLTSAAVNFDKVDFVEHYDVKNDPWQMHNMNKVTPKATLDALHARVHKWYKCSGTSCP
jgi:arylsulfatase A-like enzyme